MWESRRNIISVAWLLFTLLSGGCQVGVHEVGGANQVALTFLRAIADGDMATAMDLCDERMFGEFDREAVDSSLEAKFKSLHIPSDLSYSGVSEPKEKLDPSHIGLIYRVTLDEQQREIVIFTIQQGNASKPQVIGLTLLPA
jgi:hypothetical protein